MYYWPYIGCITGHILHVLLAICCMYYWPYIACITGHMLHVLLAICCMYYWPYIACITGHVFIGGHDGLSIFNSVERYDPELQQWMFVADMKCQRCRLGVTAAAGKIIRYGTVDIHT